MVTFLKKDQNEIEPGRKDDAEGAKPDCKDNRKSGADFQKKMFPGMVIDTQRGGKKKDGEDMHSRLFRIVKKKVGSAKEDKRGEKPKAESCLKEILHGN